MSAETMLTEDQLRDEITEHIDQAIIYMRNNPKEGTTWFHVPAWEQTKDTMKHLSFNADMFDSIFFDVFSSVESKYDDIEYINNIDEHFIRVIV